MQGQQPRGGILPSVWVPQHGPRLTLMTHPWRHDFPTVVCSVHYILKTYCKKPGLNQLLSIAISLTVEFYWQKQIPSVTIALFHLRHGA